MLATWFHQTKFLLNCSNEVHMSICDLDYLQLYLLEVHMQKKTTLEINFKISDKLTDDENRQKNAKKDSWKYFCCYKNMFTEFKAMIIICVCVCVFSHLSHSSFVLVSVGVMLLKDNYMCITPCPVKGGGGGMHQHSKRSSSPVTWKSHQRAIAATQKGGA